MSRGIGRRRKLSTEVGKRASERRDLLGQTQAQHTFGLTTSTNFITFRDIIKENDMETAPKGYFRLPPTYPTDMLECRQCGALVRDAHYHSDWHSDQHEQLTQADPWHIPDLTHQRLLAKDREIERLRQLVGDESFMQHLWGTSSREDVIRELCEKHEAYTEMIRSFENMKRARDAAYEQLDELRKQISRLRLHDVFIETTE